MKLSAWDNTTFISEQLRALITQKVFLKQEGTFFLKLFNFQLTAYI
jgi:hypothetical protein